MRKLTSPDSAAVILLVQPCDDGRDTYVEFLRRHEFAVMDIPNAWDALTSKLSELLTVPHVSNTCVEFTDAKTTGRRQQDTCT
jgi:hypothetical protein